MWLAGAGADTSLSTIFASIAGGLFVVVAAGVTGFFAFRGSSRNTDAEREKHFDERVDAELTHLRTEVNRLGTEVDRLRERNGNLDAVNAVLRERIGALRYLASSNGLDPDGPDGRIHADV